MDIFKTDTASITLAGQTFVADARGIIAIPDALQPGAFMQGFVSAKGRLKQLEVEAVAAAVAPAAENPPAPTEAAPLPAADKTSKASKTPTPQETP